jgi:hypothetical protein
VEEVDLVANVVITQEDLLLLEQVEQEEVHQVVIRLVDHQEQLIQVAEEEVVEVKQ